MRSREFYIAAFALLALAGTARALAQGAYGIGRTATSAEIAGWNIDIDRDGNNLPAGSGSVSHGHEVFDQQCAACHGAKGDGGIGDQLVGGQGTIATPKPVRTVGSYWPYAPTLFDYIRRAMPQNAPQSLDNNDVYAVSAYILNLNGLLPIDTTLDAEKLSAIKMPNRSMFVRDPRPDVRNPACMSGCREVSFGPE
jgi:S-disulfanyl-L-cysteine oxidoreductase SoxD